MMPRKQLFKGFFFLGGGAEKISVSDPLFSEQIKGESRDEGTDEELSQGGLSGADIDIPHVRVLDQQIGKPY